MKPWREIAVPHKDVLEGTFQQSEFAADISAVHAGNASHEYQDAAAFYQRTFITEGMRLLIASVAQRLNGRGGEPVIQLQTAFGGGKTHTLLAVYHLATRKCALKDLAGIPELLEQAKLSDVPQSPVVVLDGTNLSPGQPWKHGSQTIHTLWGELAWQLGGERGYGLLKTADENGTSPGKDVLKTLLEQYAPCVVLVDELVAYIRQFPDGQPLSGGSYDSNLSFVQALTEAAKLVPNAILLASLPESEVEAGSHRGMAALKAMEKTFGRVQALWKPVATEEAFEIVRRRLFEPVRDTQAREDVCRAFAENYVAEGVKMPSETQDGHYLQRLLQAYPIHPEIFDRLYEDWTTLDGFQRTRGVLKLMAKVIYRLWKDDNKDLLILAGSLPLYDGGTRNELTYYLPPGWDAVVEKDIDGERAETKELESREPRFGAVNAARRVARTLFLGSAPSSGSRGTGGIDRARVLLGCLQPGQTASIYGDALNRLADRLHYLNSSGDKALDSTRFWFDTRANLRREMEDRKGRFNDKNEVRGKIADTLRRMTTAVTLFEGIHIFTPHADVPDDASLRLVFLPPESFYSKQENRIAFESALDTIRNNGSRPRHRANRLLFIAPDHANLGRLIDSVRTALAWKSIVEDAAESRLVIDNLQIQQAKRELQSAEEVVPRAARECFKWLLCPNLVSPSDRQPTIEPFLLNTGGNSLGSELERVCTENELIISVWSPIHLRNKLKDLYWKPERHAVGAMGFWEDSVRYLYLPRFKSRGVLEQAIVKGASSDDFFGTAYSQNGDAFEGFKLGDSNVQLDETLLLIEPERAKQYHAIQLAAHRAAAEKESTSGSTGNGNSSAASTNGGTQSVEKPGASAPTAPKSRTFIGTVDVNAATAKLRLMQLAEEVIQHLTADANAHVKVVLEIHAEFPHGVADTIKRTISENTASLGFKNRSWE
jgi:predicted AAA+ superfamily ATPase